MLKHIQSILQAINIYDLHNIIVNFTWSNCNIYKSKRELNSFEWLENTDRMQALQNNDKKDKDRPKTPCN